jgi:hypothetical protein
MERLPLCPGRAPAKAVICSGRPTTVMTVFPPSGPYRTEHEAIESARYYARQLIDGRRGFDRVLVLKVSGPS